MPASTAITPPKKEWLPRRSAIPISVTFLTSACRAAVQHDREDARGRRDDQLNLRVPEVGGDGGECQHHQGGDVDGDANDQALTPPGASGDPVGKGARPEKDPAEHREELNGLPHAHGGRRDCEYRDHGGGGSDRHVGPLIADHFLFTAFTAFTALTALTAGWGM